MGHRCSFGRRCRGRWSPRGPQNGLPSPQVVAALVTQLIEVARVRGQDILIYEVCGPRNVGQPIYERIRANPNPKFQAVQFLAGSDYGLGGRMSPTPDLEPGPVRPGGTAGRLSSATGHRSEVHDQPGAAAGAFYGGRHADRKEPLRFRILPERWRLVSVVLHNSIMRTLPWALTMPWST